MATGFVKILIADDDVTTREMMVEGLSGNGYEIMVASSGAMADEMIRSNDFDLLVLDNQMDPGPTGLELCEAYGNDVQVLMISGNDIAPESLAAGAAGFLLKPVLPSQLLSAIREL